MFSVIKKKFSAKVVTLVVANILVTSLVISMVTMRSTESFLTAKISEKFPSILINTKGKIELWYSQRSLDLAVLCRSDLLLENLAIYLRGRGKQGKKKARAQMDEYFAYVKEKFPVYEDFVLIASRGQILYQTSQKVASDYDLLVDLVEQNMGRTALSQAVLLPDRSKVYQWILVPVRISNELSATVGAKVSLDHLEELLSDANLGAGGDIYLLDFRGCFLTQPRLVDVNMLGEKAMEVPTRQQGPVMVEKYRNYAKQKVFGAKVFLPERGWWLVCEEDYKRAMAPVLSTRNKVVIGDIFISALFVLVALRIVRSILRPMQQLAEGAKKVKEGMVGVSVPEGSDDEIGSMIATFNEMAKTISLAKVELQAKNKILNSQNVQLQEMNEKLERLSVTDGLTGLFNHRHFWNILNSELTRASLYREELALILIDLDDFKKVNDRFGHAVGDVLLQAVASTVKKTVRETDIVARYGGEEFAVLLPNTGKEGVLKVAEKVRKAIEQMVFKVPEADITLQVTASIGISVFRGNRRDFFNGADKALYISKSEGKNKVSMAGV